MTSKALFLESKQSLVCEYIMGKNHNRFSIFNQRDQLLGGLRGRNSAYSKGGNPWTGLRSLSCPHSVVLWKNLDDLLCEALIHDLFRQYTVYLEREAPFTVLKTRRIFTLHIAMSKLRKHTGPQVEPQGNSL